ncbi:MAG: branched-chain amino acid aminotransferase [Mesorhizobium sp.]|uniref:aminotransferase class IV n=1 Tax=Mesorhizobium sp. TaxID=1871066 RepID=UPI000FE5CC17|nr:aminotransferase class IV [Mesorhizobium sp.]RWO22457.1 MAG: branched-chain amino acid aminotransferase [Mesorhizobium sp.]
MTDGLIYMGGRMLMSGEAQVPVTSAGVKYGANVFEGLCFYRSASGGGNVFRLREHLTRLQQSIKIMRLDAAYSDIDFQQAIFQSLEANRIREDAHIRLSVIVVGEGSCDLRGPTSLVCTVSRRPPGDLADRAIAACVSSWQRIGDLNLPPRIKAGPNYHNSRFALLDAQANGYSEALLLNAAGKVSEATSACFMMVREGRLITPPVTAGILRSVTRGALLRLAQEKLSMPVDIREVDRTEVYTAEEAFLCSSFEEVRPIIALDRIQIGSGWVGPWTQRLWDCYEQVVRNVDESYGHWLTPLPHMAKTAAQEPNSVA